MKKTYMQPFVKVHQIKPANIICGSGSLNENLWAGGPNDQLTDPFDGGYWGE